VRNKGQEAMKEVYCEHADVEQVAAIYLPLD